MTQFILALVAIGVVTLATVAIGWGVRAARRRAGAAADGSEGWPGDEAIVFPGSRSEGESELPPPREETEEPSPVSSFLAGGLDELASGGDRFIEAIRDRPLQFVAGALAAGFAAGLLFPIFSTRKRIADLLERLADANEQLREKDD